MTQKNHSIAVGIEQFDEHIIFTMKAVGKLTHDDYMVFTPLLDGALASVTEPKVRMLFDATELKGWELRAAWDDFKIGLNHGSEFEKIAIVGASGWQALMAQIGSWFISGEVKYFEDPDVAIHWLCGTE
jgi:hypothetical protein